eukprot:c17510_g1_i1.p1 GENE.c17510_g1_i1~~c17510_g1_i1.p1  ORF type:complete len:293 (-),score=77.12 c17510_g1_i1:731-1609(-)
MAGVDEKQKAKIIRHFLLNSPPGQFSNVERDIRTLLGSNDLLDRTLPVIAKRYNEEQLLVVTVPGTEKKSLITKHSAIGSNEYFDPNTNSVLSYDHIKKSAESKREATDSEATPAAIAEFRSHAQKQLDAYVTEYYPDGVGLVFAKQAESGGFEITACISASKANLANRWSGRIRSSYQTTIKPGDSQASLTTDLSVKIHYFEEGNVQLNTGTTPSLTCSATDADEFAKTFIAAIQTSESNYHAKLQEAFVQLSEKTFKNLRRKLPLSGTKFDFDNWVKYSVESEINRSGQK